MNPLAHCLAAFRFLTIFPLPGTIGTNKDDLQGALPYFPLVGLVLGGIAAAAAWGAWELLSPFAAAVVLTGILLSFSGALHLDGLADCADGFFSARDRERMLEIMRDSRVGVMGVVAVVMVLLGKVSLLAGMERDGAIRAVLVMPLAGRTALVMMMATLPYARKKGGLATVFYDARCGIAVWLSLGLFAGTGYILFGVRGIAAWAGVLLFLFLFSRFCRNRIGGATGDTLGGGCELAETVVLLFLQ